jgi:hypothetical protein
MHKYTITENHMDKNLKDNIRGLSKITYNATVKKKYCVEFLFV